MHRIAQVSCNLPITLTAPRFLSLEYRSGDFIGFSPLTGPGQPGNAHKPSPSSSHYSERVLHCTFVDVLAAAKSGQHLENAGLPAAFSGAPSAQLHPQFHTP
jgi:hypothetical protein